MAPSGPLSLCLAGNSWFPWKDGWCMLVYGTAPEHLIHSYYLFLSFNFFPSFISMLDPPPPTGLMGAAPQRSKPTARFPVNQQR